MGAGAGTHASGGAGQHFELFDSVFDWVRKVTAHTAQSTRTVYARQCQEFDIDWQWTTYVLATVL